MNRLAMRSWIFWKLKLQKMKLRSSWLLMTQQLQNAPDVDWISKTVLFAK